MWIHHLTLHPSLGICRSLLLCGWCPNILVSKWLICLCLSVVAEPRTPAMSKSFQKRTAMEMQGIPASKKRKMQAAEKENRELTSIVGELLGAADESARRALVGSLLQWAVYQGRADQAAKLVKFRPNLNRRYKDDMTLLMTAASRGDVECLDVLINAGAHLNLADKEGKTALIHCSHDIEVDENQGPGSDAFHVWVRRNRPPARHVECVRLLVEAGADLCYEKVYHSDVDDWNPNACGAQYEGTFRTTALHSAIRAECMECVKLLAAPGVLDEECAGILLEGEIHETKEIREILKCAGRVGKRRRSLMELCRTAIRKQLLEVNPETSLFVTVGMLKLPTRLENLLLLGA